MSSLSRIVVSKNAPDWDVSHRWWFVHVLGQAVEVLLLLVEPLLELQELLLLALADGKVLLGPLTALESVTGWEYNRQPLSK
jgi:hypothetical protein